LLYAIKNKFGNPLFPYNLYNKATEKGATKYGEENNNLVQFIYSGDVNARSTTIITIY